MVSSEEGCEHEVHHCRAHVEESSLQEQLCCHGGVSRANDAAQFCCVPGCSGTSTLFASYDD